MKNPGLKWEMVSLTVIKSGKERCPLNNVNGMKR